MKNDSKSKSQKKYLKNSKKRKLDIRSLESNSFGVVSSTDVIFPVHSVKLSSALLQLSQAGSDLKRVCPQFTYGEVIIELPTHCKLKFVIPATAQGALDVNGDTAFTVTNADEPMAHGRPCLSIEESALVEARQIAEAASQISMAAVDVGNQLVDQAEKNSLALEDAVVKLAESPDEKVSRNSYGRAGGQEKTIRYSSLGERTIGGNHIVVADLLSTDTLSLTGCKVLQGKRKGSYRLQGQPDDPEWIRLAHLNLDEIDLFDLKETPAMELLGYALTSNHVVDIDVCLAEKVSKKQRRLAPLKIRNRSKIIARTRDRLELLEESEAS